MPRLSAPLLRFCALALTLAASLLAHTAARAVPLIQPVGSANFADTVLPGTTVALRPELTGTVVEDLSTAFSFQGITGTVLSRVMREDATGTLDFLWRVDVASVELGTTGVTALRLVNFGYGFLTDADWLSDDPGMVAPSVGRLFNETAYPMGAINFLFDTSVDAGAQSHFFFLRTDATSYGMSAYYDLLGGAGQNLSSPFSTFAPVETVPEPASAALVVLGLSAAGLAARRRRG